MPENFSQKINLIQSLVIGSNPGFRAKQSSTPTNLKQRRNLGEISLGVICLNMICLLSLFFSTFSFFLPFSHFFLASLGVITPFQVAAQAQTSSWFGLDTRF